MRFVNSAGGYEQITGMSTVKTLTIPANAAGAFLQSQDQNIRFRCDGTDPTASVGMVLLTTEPPLFVSQAKAGMTADGLASMRFIEVMTGAKLNVQYVYES